MYNTTIKNSDDQILTIDATMKDSRSFSNKITEKPIEDGSCVSDALILNNTKYTLQGIVSNTPIVNALKQDVTVEISSGFLNTASQFLNGYTTENSTVKTTPVKSDTYVLNAYNFLTNLMSSSKVFSVKITGYPELKNLLPTSLHVDFDQESGDALHFNLEFEKIKMVSSKTTTVPKNANENKVANVKSNGTTKTEKPKEDESFLMGIGQKVKGLF